MYELILELLSEMYSTNKSLLKEIYPSLSDKPVSMNKLLYNKDGKTLKERIEQWCKEENISLSSLFSCLCRILETESHCILVNLARYKLNLKYVEIFGLADCGEDGPCIEYYGEIYDCSTMTEDMWPPYHPFCSCFPIFYTEDEIEIIK